MRRLFWLALGAVVGVLVVRRLTRAADTLTPAGLADAVGDLGAWLRDFAADVRGGMAAREVELRDALGLQDSLDNGIQAGFEPPSPNGETPAHTGGPPPDEAR